MDRSIDWLKLIDAMERHAGNRRAVARELGVSRQVVVWRLAAARRRGIIVPHNDSEGGCGRLAGPDPTPEEIAARAREIRRSWGRWADEEP